VSIVYILYIVYLPYARNMHGKEFSFVRYRTCDLADKGVIPTWIYYSSIITKDNEISRLRKP
jgi:hypothetical protein